MTDPDDDLDIPAIRQRLRTLGMRPSKSAEEARARELREIEAMSIEERILLALRLGRRDRETRSGFVAASNTGRSRSGQEEP